MDSKRTYIVAVSGGVDSVALLDMLVRVPNLRLIVAHFNHGIRPDADEDEELARSLASKYSLPYESQRAELGRNASEEVARRARYVFLRNVAQRYDAQIVTAHHADDILETIILNISRGTGWRGLASLRNTSEIARPLLAYRKQQLQEYAKSRNLQWREDSTNRETKYLRNAIRHTIIPKLGKQTEEILLELYRRQIDIRQELEEATESLLEDNKSDDAYRRHLFIMSEPEEASEMLYELLRRETGAGTTRSRLVSALLAIKTAKANTTYQVGDGVSFVFTARTFSVKK